ncbi:MAG: flagellar biosynthetic protein FliO [Phycisphaerae bacterium]|nr:flagellar biosynthetic protein FliO [Phycisphaerae bacterium]
MRLVGTLALLALLSVAADAADPARGAARSEPVAGEAKPTPEDLGLSRADPWSADFIAPPIEVAPTTSEPDTATDANAEAVDRPLPRKRAPASAPTQTTSIGTKLPWTRSAAALVGVLALIALLAWGYRSFTSGTLARLPRRRRTATIEVLSRAALSPRHSVCLLRIGDRAVLVGLSPQSVATLDVVSEPLAVARLAGQSLSESSNTAGDFTESLAVEKAAHAAIETVVSRAQSSATGPQPESPQAIDRIRERLSDTLARLRTNGGRS